MSNNEDLRRELEQYIAHHHATDVEGVTDAIVASSDEEDDALLEAMTQAVTPQFLGDDGTQTGGAPGALPVGNALNNADLDEAMTAYFNRRI